MKLSLKHMVISFVAALLLLSLIMTAICVSVFRSRVNEHRSDGEGIPVSGLPERSARYAFSSTAVYYEEKDGSVAYAALVGIDETNQMITVTPFAATLPVPFKTSIYFVSTICESEGKEALCNIASALTGVEADTLMDTDAWGIAPAGSIDAFTYGIKDFLATRYGEYEIKTVPVALDQDGVADTEKTVEAFFKVESNLR